MPVYSLNNRLRPPHAAIEPRSPTHESSPTESAIITQIAIIYGHSFPQNAELWAGCNICQFPQNFFTFFCEMLWNSILVDDNERALGFLARDSIYAIARSLPTPVRLSVCLSVPLSVTRVDQSKTFEVRITQSSPQCSPMTLLSSRGTAP